MKFANLIVLGVSIGIYLHCIVHKLTLNFNQRFSYIV